MTKEISSRISNEALKAKTGKTFEEWFTILDAMKATEMTHTEIAAALYNKYGEDKGWYFQMITNTYEVARGLRKKHQKKDGYEISISKTIGVSLPVLYDAWHDEKKLISWLEEKGLAIRKATSNKSMRITPSDGKTSLSVDFYDKGLSKSQIVVQHRKLATPQEAEAKKVYWKEKLEILKCFLEQ